jgi:hypothetical protein
VKVQKYQADDERSILTGMIVNTRVLSRVHAHLKKEKRPFRSRWSNLVGQWCLTHFDKYNIAPQKDIVVLFREFAESSQDDDTSQLVEKYLSSLNDEYARQDLNEDHLIDVAARYFNQVKMEKLNQSIESDLLKKDVDAAKEKFATFSPVNLATSDMVDVLTDAEAWRDAINPNENDVLIRYPGELGTFFSDHLCRDGFISFVGPEKSGKSWWLMDMAWRAAIDCKRRTVLYSVGDMSQRQMMKRIAARALRRPLKSGEVEIPKSIKKLPKSEPVVTMGYKNYPERVTMSEVKKAVADIRMKTAHSQSLLKLRCTSNSTTRVMDIRADLDNLIKDGFICDVCLIDYSDILAPEASMGENDYRHQINETWKALRRLSQDYHILVVTATQANTAAYNKKLLRKENFSEDKRKNAHVTGMVGINQTEEEKQKGIYRLNWILLREGIYYESECITVAGSLAIANPAMFSVW